MMGRLTDEQLVDFLQQGQKKAFEEVYNRYWYTLYGVAYQSTGTREEAEELVHDLFENLWNRRESLVIRHLGSYLVVAIKHLATNYIKSKITHRKYQEYLILNEIRQSYSTQEILDFEDLSEAVEEVMKRLPERTSEIFRMSRFENQSVKDIANRFNLSEKAVEYHITKSLKVLKEGLQMYDN
ncbi:RNA polymerase sigma-70 factor [Siphonobacter aquaeclarae]|jgi:RNA polymerase sigma-70 factor (family 1)|uniref:RNA polymerase sigma-70 factor, ECF subfamily n=1 Tax=Siphonobacter aquaeclarae TaxID=563176 RepID=A0A1G9XVS5_9BACT|nr:RNA polymerase sigma-70 factor [Siphonobacter aquaeclarae]SDN00255.1 RNA polymerase sigma-70 factor, ECF subfamily [Siphonobacter aquaeclarae]